MSQASNSTRHTSACPRITMSTADSMRNTFLPCIGLGTNMLCSLLLFDANSPKLVSSPTELFRLFQLSQPQLFTKLNKEPFIDTRHLSAYLPEQSATGSQSSGHRPLPPTLLHSSPSPPAQGHLVIQNRRPTPRISQKHW